MASVSDLFNKVTKSPAFTTIADTLISGLTRQSTVKSGEMNVNGGQTVTVNYSAANNIDQKISDVKKVGENIVSQVKGLFGLVYESPQTKTTSPPTPTIKSAGGDKNLLVIGAAAVIAYLLLK